MHVLADRDPDLRVGESDDKGLSARCQFTFDTRNEVLLDIPMKADEVDGSRSRHLGAKMGCCHASPSKGATRHGD